MADPMIEHLVALHRGLPRQGPGDTASTQKALELCAGLPSASQILDIGCGSGAQTLVLAEATQGTVTGVDLHDAILQGLTDEAARRGLTARVKAVRGDMTALPFPEESFDLLWSEGAIYIMGFDAGLDAWRPLLRAGGCLAVTELSWLTPNPPAEASAFWAEGYPAMRSIEANLAGAEAAGFEVVGHFVLPARTWTDEYYGPLAARLDPYLAEHPGDAVAEAVVAGTREEIAMYERFGDTYGYVFYVLRRSD
ncbi:MAG: class I SAM-dependent methyltransferase [Deltaproteobacteria bacterium]|nr:class I SAM-dependent methyltransferase [Deltaproteobacteria bacterium]